MSIKKCCENCVKDADNSIECKKAFENGMFVAYFDILWKFKHIIKGKFINRKRIINMLEDKFKNILAEDELIEKIREDERDRIINIIIHDADEFNKIFDKKPYCDDDRMKAYQQAINDYLYLLIKNIQCKNI